MSVGIDDILSRLERVTPTKTGWQARCPSHDDKSPSLSIAIRQDGAPLLHCHAGCRFEDVVSAIGLTLADLAPDAPGKRNGTLKRPPGSKKTVETVEAYVDRLGERCGGIWQYHHADGTPAMVVVRINEPTGKTFRPLHTEGDRWAFGDPPGPLPLYRLTDVHASDDVVYIVEGERCVDAARSLELTATTSAHGSKSAKRTDWSTLAGREVCILPDNDDPGRMYAETVAGILTKLDPPASVKVVTLPDLPEGGDIVDWIEAKGETRTDDELADGIRELYDLAEHWRDDEEPARVPTADTGNTRDPLALLASAHRTDLGNAQRLVALHGNDLRYSTAFGWLCWDGTRWAIDDTGEAERRAKDTVGQMYRVLPAIEDTDKRATLAKHAAASEAASRIRAMLGLSQSEPGIAVRAEDLDGDPWSLNVANGTIDLRTGKLRPHRRDDLCTKLAPVDFDPDATSDLWDKFLTDIFEGNQALIDFAQRATGAALSGVVRDHVLHVLWGSGANGKSTFLNAILSTLGDYGKTVVPRLLVQRRSEQHLTELAQLRGVRLAVATESGEGGKLDEERVKAITGGDPITARLICRDPFTFAPSHSLLLCTNHRPRVRGTDYGIWRRLKLWPFTRCFSDNEQDRSLGEKLERERPSILAWAIRGCLAWQSDGGLRTPDVVAVATEQYRTDEDVVEQFIQEACTTGPDCLAASGDLLDRFNDWSGRKTSAQALTRMLEDHGYERTPRGAQGKRYWKRLGLIQVTR